MGPTDNLCEVEFIWGPLVDLGANDDHIRTLNIQMSKEIGRLHRGSPNISFLGECGREQMAAHRIAVDDQDAKFRCNIRFGFLSLVFRALDATGGPLALKVVAARRLL